MHFGDEENNSRNGNEDNQQNIYDMNTNNDVAGGGAEISDEVAAEVPSLLLKNAVPRKDDIIEYRENASDESVSAWKQVSVMSRAGKQSGNNRAWVNVGGEGIEPFSLNLDKVEWRKVDNVEEVNVVLVPEHRHHDEDVLQAKEKELKTFETLQVFEEVEDIGQERISLRWVVTEKSVGMTSVVKARLVCRGFEENCDVQTDSPTCGKDVLRIFLSTAAMNGWVPEFTDMMSAFLQGEPLDRDVFVEPPVEVKQSGVIWRLRVCVYGLNDAPRKWFLKVEKEVLAVGCAQSRLSPAMFMYKRQGFLAGMIILHVDDFLHAGNELFQENVIQKIREKFTVGATGINSFRYTGLNIRRHFKGITLDQNHYVDELEFIDLDSERRKQKSDILNDEEKTSYRSAVGAVNWAAQQTRPDMSFEVMEMSMKFKNPSIEDITRANKCIKRMKTYGGVRVMFHKLSGSKTILSWSDGAFANLQDRVSSGAGHVIVLADSHGHCCPLAWNANKVKRVVKSTLASEALALEEAIGHALYLQAIIRELLSEEIDIVCLVDSDNLVKAVNSSREVEDKRLRIDIATIKETIDKDQISVYHVPGMDMIANPLTKRGAKSDDLLDTLRKGVIAEGLLPDNILRR